MHFILKNDSYNDAYPDRHPDRHPNTKPNHYLDHYGGVWESHLIQTNDELLEAETFHRALNRWKTQALLMNRTVTLTLTPNPNPTPNPYL